MNNIIRLIPPSVVKIVFNKDSIWVDTQATWNEFNNLTGGVSQAYGSKILWDSFISIGVSASAIIHPEHKVIYNPGKGCFQNQNQIDELMEVIEIVMKELCSGSPSKIITQFPNIPSTLSEEKLFYSYIRRLMVWRWRDLLRKQMKEPLGRVLNRMNSSKILPKNRSNMGMDGNDLDSNDEVVDFDPIEVYQHGKIISSLPLNEYFTSEKLFTYFADQYSNTLGVNLERKAICDYLQTLSELNLAKTILPATFTETEYRVIEQEPRDSNVDLIATGPIPFYYDSELAIAGTGKSDAKIGFVIYSLPIIGEKVISQLNSELLNNNLDEINILSLQGKLSEEANDIIDEKIRVWDLIDLAKYIQEKFKTLPKSTQDELSKMIEEYAKDF